MTITIFRRPDGIWTFHDQAGSSPVDADLDPAWQLGKGIGGQPILLPKERNALGLGIAVALERGILKHIM